MTSPSSSPREPLVPTINFSMVCPGVYRSGYPTKKNYSFLCALRLRSILYLCPEDYAESNLKFCEDNGIHVLRFPTEGNKEPFNDISEPLMHRILGAICDTRNLPLLIHCNKGKHRTGTVVACLRHLQGWSLVSIFEEYKRFASDKARVGDQQYVELYHPIVKLTPPFVAPWVIITPRVTLVTSDRELMEAEALQLGSSLLAPDKPAKKEKAVKAATAAAAFADPGGVALTGRAAPVSGAVDDGVAVSAAGAAPTQAPPSPSPNIQPVSSPPSAAAATVSVSSTVEISESGSDANPPPPPAVPLPPTPPPPQQQQPATPIPVHAATITTTAAPSVNAATTTSTNVSTNAAAMVGSSSTNNNSSGAGDGATHASAVNHSAGQPAAASASAAKSISASTSHVSMSSAGAAQGSGAAS
jgi:tyrosine-protein phosphatase SIW14